jgi:hypothetical protein
MSKNHLDYKVIAQAFILTRSGKIAYKRIGRNIADIESFIKSVCNQMHECAEVVESGKGYMLKAMFPAQYWNRLTDSGRDDERGFRKIIVGYIASFLVKRGFVPFERYVTPSGSGSRKYCLK